MMQAIDGYKTYFVAVGMLMGALAAYFGTDPPNVELATELVAGALVAAGLRHGMPAKDTVVTQPRRRVR